MTDGWGWVEWFRAVGWTAGVFFTGMAAAFALTRQRYQRMVADMEAQQRYERQLAEQVIVNVCNSKTQ